MLACSGGAPNALPPTVLATDAHKPPVGIAMLVSAPSPQRDLAKLATLLPSTTHPSGIVRELREIMLLGPSQARSELGEGLSDAADQAGPIFFAFGADPEHQIAFAVRLHTDLGPLLPEWLELIPWGQGVSRLRARNDDHDWPGRDGACEISRRSGRPSVLVCASAADLLERWGEFLASLPARTKGLPSIELRVFPSIFTMPLRELDREDPVENLMRDLMFDYARNLDEIRLTGVLRERGIEFAAEFRYRATSDALSIVTAGARAAERPLPPSFDEIPRSALLGISFSELDQATTAPVLRAFERSVASAVGQAEVSPSADASRPKGTALGLAMGVDFFPTPISFEPVPAPPEPPPEPPETEGAPGPQSLRPDSRAFFAQEVVDLDEEEGPVTRSRPERLTGTPWFLFRVEGDLERVRSDLLKALAPREGPGVSAGRQSKTSAERKDLPAGTVYIVPTERLGLHALIVPKGSALLIAIAENGETVWRVGREALRADASFRDYFRPPEISEAAGLGFMSVTLGGALGAMDYPGVSPAALERLRARHSGVSPAPFRYFVQRGADGSAMARATLELPSAFIRAWLSDLSLVLEDSRYSP
jgi:hypothetical protein